MGHRVLTMHRYNPLDSSCSYDNTHDPTVPAQMWFQQSTEGDILFVVFYSQACRWHRCLGCNLPSKMSSHHIGYKELMAQVDHVFADPEVMDRRQKISKVIVSNNGSVLDQETFSSTALMYLLAKLNLNFSNLSVLTLETRPEYVEPVVLEFINRALSEGDTPTNLEIAIGFEAFDTHIRNSIFHKGLRFDAFEKFVKKISPYHHHLKCYFMQKPVPRMTDEEAVEDIRAAIGYLDSVSSEYKLNVNLHLNPTYVAKGTALEEAFRNKKYTPPHLFDVARAVAHGEGKHLSIYVGLSDEGLAVEGGSFIRPGDEQLLSLLERFNQTQDYTLLKGINHAEDDLGQTFCGSQYC
jgi:radical SAM enzyme (TIGR01210 family)